MKFKQNYLYNFQNKTHTKSTSNCLSPTDCEDQKRMQFFFGVTLNNKLKFNIHIQIIGKKMADLLVLTINSETLFHLIFQAICTILSYTPIYSIAILLGQVPMKFILNLCLYYKKG